MEQILNKNNTGVEHACNGRYNEARKSLKEALVELSALHEHQKADESNITINNQSLLPSPIYVDNRCIPEPLSSTNLYTYRNLMTTAYLEQIKKEHYQTNETEDFVAVLITFNLSLTLQYILDKDFEFGSRKWNEELKNIIRLYKNVLKLLKLDANSSRRPYHDIISLAVMNNMGIIFYQLAMYDKARGFVKPLKQTLRSCAGSYALQSELRDGIMRNILFLENRLSEKKATAPQLLTERLPSACTAATSN